MKLRIKGNSIRLRLTQAEVQQIFQNQPVKEETVFSSGPALTYALYVKQGHETTANFSENELSVIISEDTARQWAGSDEVSIRGEQKIADGQSLKILIEKDFQCLKPREGDEDADTFPHPQMKEQNC